MDTVALAKGFIDILKEGGPWAIVVFVAWFAMKKDRAKEKQASEFLDRALQLSEKQTRTNIQMEATLASFKDLLNSMDRRLGSGGRRREDD